MLPSRDVVVTGIGIVLPGCDTRRRFWDQLRRGESQLRFVPDPAGGVDPVPAGCIDDFDPHRYLDEFDDRYFAGHGRAVQMFLSALALARRDAAIDLRQSNPERIGFFDGTSRDGFAFWYDR